VNTPMAIGIAVILLAGNAFFVGAEFALISARRSQIEPLAARGSRRAITTLRAMERVSLMMACAQLGITVCSLGLGAVGEPAVARVIESPLDAAGVPEGLLHPIAFAVALGVVVTLHMVLGEMVPKNIAIAGPERSALLLGPPLWAVVRVLRPLILTLNAIANGVLRLLGVEPKNEVASSFTADEVSLLVAQSHEEGLLDASEHELLTGALSFEERNVSSLLIPLDRLAVLPPGATAEDVQAATARTGFSRFPVGGEGGLIGYLHVKDLLAVSDAAQREPVGDATIRPLAHVAAGASLRSALEAMQTEGSHLAEVRGADGICQGVLALEDVLEELVGEIRDAAQAAARGSSRP